MNTLRIRSKVHPLDAVVLYLRHRGSPEEGLQFSLFADCDELRRAGFAINCMSVRGTTRIAHLLFDLGADDTDALNELGESVICEPGAVLELASLRIAFGQVQDGLVNTTLTAVCQKRGEENIPVLGVFAAWIVQEDEPSGQTSQLVLPL